MSFVMSLEHGRHVPRIFCDHCGVLIQEIGMGGVVYPPGEDGDRLLVRVLCKENRCLELDRSESWQELSHWLIWLLQNTGVRTREAFDEQIEAANWLADVA
jgi:hypothetical protein